MRATKEYWEILQNRTLHLVMKRCFDVFVSLIADLFFTVFSDFGGCD